jgi:hypothetical protein
MVKPSGVSGVECHQVSSCLHARGGNTRRHGACAPNTKPSDLFSAAILGFRKPTGTAARAELSALKSDVVFAFASPFALCPLGAEVFCLDCVSDASTCCRGLMVVVVMASSAQGPVDGRQCSISISTAVMRHVWHLGFRNTWLRGLRRPRQLCTTVA